MSITMSSFDKQEIQNLVAEGEDELIATWLFQLADLPREQVEERFELLMNLGMRCAVLAAKVETGQHLPFQTGFILWVESLLTRPANVIAAVTSRPKKALRLYKSAIHYFTAASTLCSSTTAAYSNRVLVRTLQKDAEKAIVEATRALEETNSDELA